MSAPTVVRVTTPSLDHPDDCLRVAETLAAGAVVAHGFANFYAITTRGDADTVRRVNQLKGRPLTQTGSITGPPDALVDVWDLDRLPAGLSRRRVLDLVDTLLALGPFGFRGPAAAHVPTQLTCPDGDIRTAQVIAPGYACPSNAFLADAARLCGDDLLYITSANRSRHLTGADDSPAHWRADGLVAEFGDAGLVILPHGDEAVARQRYPSYLPMSTTIISFHRLGHSTGDPRPQLILERHGSMSVEAVRAVLDGLGFGVVLGPKAQTRLLLRDYSLRSTHARHPDP